MKRCLLTVFLLFAVPTSSFALSPFSFPDVQHHWAHVVIMRMVKADVLSGYPDGYFRPDQSVSREEFTSMLIRTLRIPGSSNPPVFTDVEPDRWSAKVIEAAVENGIILPQEYGSSFAPSQAIRRDEMAAMIARALQLKGSGNKHFSDGNGKHADLISAASEAGLISGYEDGTFRPDNSLTRAEAAAVLSRVYDYKANGKKLP